MLAKSDFRSRGTNSLTSRSPSGVKGILRLRGCFASRTIHFAHDDSHGVGELNWQIIL
jgi:hypothetical protein